MAEQDLKQVMLDAIVDADSLEQFVNGSETETVLTRLSAEYPTLQNSIKQMFENGGLPATPFKTKALMTASSLPDGSYAAVTNDSTKSNNGIYLLSNGVWELSVISSSATFASDYLSTVQGKVREEVLDLDSEEYGKLNATFIKGVSTYTLRFDENSESIIVPVESGDYLNIVADGMALLAKVNTSEGELTNGRIFPVEDVFIIEPNDTLSIYADGSFDAFCIVTRSLGRVSARPKKASLLSNFTLSSNSVVDTLQDTSKKKPLSANAGRLLNDKINSILPDFPSSQVINVDDDFDKVFDVYVRTNSSSPSGFVWESNEGDYLAKIPLGDAVAVSMQSTTSHISILVFGFEGDDIRHGVHIPAGSKSTVIDAGSKVIEYRPKGSTHIYVSVVSRGLNRRPAKLELLMDGVVTLRDTENDWQNISMGKIATTDLLLDMLRSSSSVNSVNILSAELPEKTSVFAAHKNIILKDEQVDGVSHIFTSTDIGKTWVSTRNIIGKITNFHIFIDGSIMLCGANKVYYMQSGDYTTLHESVVTDYDGQPVVEDAEVHYFYSLTYGNQTQYVDGVEVYAWGQYALSGNTRVWYTPDRGRTIKCALRFDKDLIEGSLRPVRHCHMLTQYYKDESFYLTTGDSNHENRVLRGVYNVQSDSWEWKQLASGNFFKFGDIYFDDHYAYVVTDFNATETKPHAGMYRVAIENIGDFSKYHCIFKPLPGELQAGNAGTLSRYIEDDNGIKVIFPDAGARGRVWIAAGDMNFTMVRHSPNVNLMLRLGSTDNGDVYITTNYEGNEIDGNVRFINHGSYNISEFVRSVGVGSFMRNSTLIGSTWIK